MVLHVNLGKGFLQIWKLSGAFEPKCVRHYSCHHSEVTSVRLSLSKLPSAVVLRSSRNILVYCLGTSKVDI
jgi:hypothetical protein